MGLLARVASWLDDRLCDWSSSWHDRRIEQAWRESQAQKDWERQRAEQMWFTYLDGPRRRR